MPFTSINGIDIYYQLEGEGETIVLLHHGFGCSRMWKDVFTGLVNTGFRVLAYDRRGYGSSGAGDGFPEFYLSDGFRDYSVDEMNRVVDKLGLESFHIVGQCEGGVVGVDYAAAYPERVLSLTIASTFCYSRVTMEEFNRVNFPLAFGELDPGLREKMKTWHGADRAGTFFEMFRTYGGAYGRDVFDLRPQLPKVGCPSLVLYPDRSALFEVEQGVMFYRNLPDAQLAVIPKCGHNTYEYVPDEYLRQVTNFLVRIKLAVDLGPKTCMG